LAHRLAVWTEVFWFPRFLQANVGIKFGMFWWAYMKILVKDEGANRCERLTPERLIRSFWTKV
jgi:hypothetical protein